MKSVTRITIVMTCIFVVVSLLYPPWVDSYTKKFVGFYFITGEGVDNIYRAQIDYAKLAVILLCIGSAAVAAYFTATSNAAHGVMGSIRRTLKPSAATTSSAVDGVMGIIKRILQLLASAWAWLGKYWLWLLVAAVLIRVVSGNL